MVENKKYLLIVFILFLPGLNLCAQTCEEMLKSAQSSERHGKYFDAYKKYSAAATRCGDSFKQEIENRQQILVDKLEEQRERADKSEKKAALALAQVQEEQRKTAAALIITEKAKIRTDSALAKADSILNMIYFYDNRFGLAYKNGKYGFIDTKLNTKIKFKYETATNFNDNGFAKVSRDGILFLIDTFGIEYTLATQLHHLNKETMAIDFSGSDLDSLPSQIFECEKLRILILAKNKIRDIPKEILFLDELEYLDISYNYIRIIPKEIDYFKQLKTVRLWGNPIKKLDARSVVLDGYKKLKDIKIYNSFKDFNKRLSLGRDTIFLIHYWATYCSSDLFDLPFIDNVSINNSNIKVILVSLDFKSQMEQGLGIFLNKNKIDSEIILLDDPDADSWVPLVDQSWDGGLPFTVIIKNNKNIKSTSERFESPTDVYNFVK